MAEVKLIAWTQVNWNLINGYKGFESDAKQGIEALIEFAGAVEGVLPLNDGTPKEVVGRKILAEGEQD